MELDLTKIIDVAVEGIDTKDAPDFVDAFITQGLYLDRVEGTSRYRYRPLTEEEIDFINEHHSDFVFEQVEKTLY